MQAAENALDVMGKLLKVQGRMQEVQDKLEPMKTTDSQQPSNCM